MRPLSITLVTRNRSYCEDRTRLINTLEIQINVLAEENSY